MIEPGAILVAGPNGSSTATRLIVVSCDAATVTTAFYTGPFAWGARADIQRTGPMSRLESLLDSGVVQVDTRYVGKVGCPPVPVKPA